MNTIYRVIWNHTLGVYQVCSELTKRMTQSFALTLSGRSELNKKHNRYPQLQQITLIITLGLSSSTLAATTFNGEYTFDENKSYAGYIVGANASGTLNIGTNIVASASDASSSVIGQGTNGRGTVNVYDGGFWDLVDHRYGADSPLSLNIGQEGNGVLNIESGGLVTAGQVILGKLVSSSGEVNVSGNGSILNTRDMLVGQSGTGELLISDYGLVNSSFSSSIGQSRGSSGVVHIENNGQWIIRGTDGQYLDLVVGDSGEGEFYLSTGGKASVGQIQIGKNNTGNGVINVSGVGTELNTYAIQTGLNGVGTLNISDYGVVNFSGQSGSLLDFNGGYLTLSEGGISNGMLTGEGNFHVTGNILDIIGANGNLSVTHTIDSGAEISLNNGAGAGRGNIVNEGILRLKGVKNTLSNSLRGRGEVYATAWTDVHLRGDNSNFSGLFNIEDGSAITISEQKQLGTAGVIDHGMLIVMTGQNWQLKNEIIGNGDLEKTGDATLTLTNASAGYSGTTQITAGELTLGATLDSIVKMTSTQVNIHNGAVMSGFVATAKNVDVMQGGELHVSRTTIGGDLVNSGTVRMNRSGASPGNQLIVNGNYTGNNNGLIAFNTTLNGDESPTDKVIVTGDTRGSTRVVVNNIDGQGAQTDKGIELIEVNGDSAGSFALTHGTVEAGAYVYSLAKGTGEGKKNWYCQVGGHERSTSGHDQLKTQSNRYVVQLGGDLAQWNGNSQDRWHLGIMVGYANEHSNTRNERVGYRSDGRIDGYSVGMYGTWYQNDADKVGAYVDSWVLYNWFNNTVESDHRQGDSYRSRGFTASLEAGYTFLIGEFTGSEGTLNSGYVQPQVQVTWMGVKEGNHTRSDGTYIETEGDGNVQTRLGVRTYLNSYHRRDAGKQREFQPYIEANNLYNSEVYAVKMNGTKISREGSRHLAELRTGVEAKLNNNLAMWGNVGVQIGDKGYSDTQGMLGVKYSW